MRLNWIGCKGDVWCTLSKVGLDNITAVGVYVIWKPGTPGTVIHTGQGVIKDRLSVHREDPVITRHGKDLLVTWASVPADSMDGVERFLYDRFRPVEGQRAPDVLPIPVNLPGE